MSIDNKQLEVCVQCFSTAFFSYLKNYFVHFLNSERLI